MLVSNSSGLITNLEGLSLLKPTQALQQRCSNPPQHCVAEMQATLILDEPPSMACLLPDQTEDLHLFEEI